MSNSRFVHLHVHTEFSLADSTIRVPAKPDQTAVLVEEAAADAQAARDARARALARARET